MRTTLFALSVLLLSFTTTSALNLRSSGKKGIAKDINLGEENTSTTLTSDSNYAPSLKPIPSKIVVDTAVNPQKHRALSPSIHKWYSFRDFCDKRLFQTEGEQRLLYDCPGYREPDGEYINNAWRGISISGPQRYCLWTTRRTTMLWSSRAEASAGTLGPYPSQNKADHQIELSFQYHLFEQDFPATTNAVILNLQGVLADFQVLAYDEVGDVVYDSLFTMTYTCSDYGCNMDFEFNEIITIMAPRIATVKIIPDHDCRKRNCYLDPGGPCYSAVCWVNFWGGGTAIRGEALGIGALAPIGITNFTWPSPVLPPAEDDHTFVSTSDAGLDTKCTYRSGSPLIFSIPLPRVIGNRNKLLANGLLPDKATLQMSVFSMDTGSSFPESDQVSLNGNILEGLSSQIGEWKLNSFQIPFGWIRFPTEPDEGLAAMPEDNIVRIDIDPLSDGSEQWCTAIDWGSLTIGDIPLPVVMVHGIRADGDMWQSFWEPRLQGMGIPNDGNLDMGPADSIQSNAKKIERKIAQAKRRWGVKQITAVAHSKGGLDMRHYVENAHDVHQLVQLGTPNLGSTLADFVQMGYIEMLIYFTVTLGPVLGPAALAVMVGGVIFEYATVPGWAQLTTLHMKDYNSIHGHNPDVRYTSVAGVYTPDLTCSHIPLESCISIFIVGPGDTVVPVSSQLGSGLGYISGTIHYSSGPNIDATHSGLAESEDVFKLVQEDLLDSRSLLQQTETDDSYDYSMLQSKAGVVTEGEIVTFSIVIDEIVPEAHLMIFYAGSLGFQLTSPSGTVIDHAGGSGDSETNVGRIVTYDIITPERGSWRISVTGVDVVESIGYAPFLVTATLLESSIKLKPALIRPSVPKGVPLIFTGTLTDNDKAIKGANASALIEKPDGTIDSIVLLDDGIAPDLIAGDGVYTGSLASTEQVGTYRSVIVAENLLGTQFSREGFVLGVVSSSASAFNGNFSDFGVDENLDGLYEKLVVEAGVNTDVDRVYRIFGQLLDSVGNEQTVSFERYLSLGLNHVQLVFDGRQIFRNEIDGPYTLSRIRLAEEEDTSLAILDDIKDPFLTSAYTFDQFQPTGPTTPETSTVPTTTKETSTPESTTTEMHETTTAAEETSTTAVTPLTSLVTEETSTVPTIAEGTSTLGSTTESTTQPPIGEESSTTTSTVPTATEVVTTTQAQRSKTGKAQKAPKQKSEKYTI